MSKYSDGDTSIRRERRDDKAQSRRSKAEVHSTQRALAIQRTQNVVVRPTRSVRGKPGEMFVLLSALR